MKTIKFTDSEIDTLKTMLASGASDDYIEVRACKSFIEKLEEGK